MHMIKASLTASQRGMPAHDRYQEEDLEPLRLVRASLHTQIITTLRGMIQLGEMAPGAVISEREICAQLGISRTPLREALKVLASENLVQLRPHRAPLVSNVDPAEVAELFELLSVIEPAAAELACQRATDDELRELSRMHEELVALYEARKRTPYFSLNLAVHHEIIRLARNKVMLGTYEALQSRVARARSIANLNQDRWAESNLEHGQLIAAFRSRDYTAVKTLLRAHTESTSVAVLRGLKAIVQNDETPSEAVEDGI
jgi:DNA-binding GntR family transcriptional regulator